MLGDRWLVAAALAVSFAALGDAACVCTGTNQTIDPTKSIMLIYQNPSDDKTGSPCASDCTYLGYARDDKHGLAIQVVANGLIDGTVKVYDGETYWFTVDKAFGSKAVTDTTTTNNIKLEFTGEKEGGKETFIIAVTETNAPATRTTPKPATTRATTQKYEGPYGVDPSYITADIMIIVDTSGTPDNVQLSKDVAAGFAAALDVEKTIGSGVRISLHALTGVEFFKPTYLPDWTFTQETIGNFISVIQPLGTKTSYYGYINEYLETAFGENNNRTHTARYVVLVTSTGSPVEFDPAGIAAPDINFHKYGVHPLLIGIGLDNQQKAYFNSTLFSGEKANNKWSSFDYTARDGKDDVTANLVDFINGFLLDASETSCDSHNELTIVKDSKADKPENQASIPPYYDGASQADSYTWGDDQQYYCNFQTESFFVNADKAKDETDPRKMCFTVYYELEPERDFVRIFEVADDKSEEELVSLTGKDVSGSQFTISTWTARIEFASDEKNVYDGFHLEVDDGPCKAADPNPPPPDDDSGETPADPEDPETPVETLRLVQLNKRANRYIWN